jgi:hypothetical protein
MKMVASQLMCKFLDVAAGAFMGSNGTYIHISVGWNYDHCDDVLQCMEKSKGNFFLDFLSIDLFLVQAEGFFVAVHEQLAEAAVLFGVLDMVKSP